MRMREVVLTGVAGLLILTCANRALVAEAAAPKKDEVVKEEPQKPTADWEGEIRRKLSRKVSFEFVDTPVMEGVAFFRTLARVDLIVDPKVLEKDLKPVTLRVTEMDIATAMTWFLRVAGLTWQLKDQAVFMTWSEERHETDEGLSVYRLRQGLPEGLTAEKLKVLSATAAPKARVAYDADLKVLVIACDDQRDLRRVETLLKTLGIEAETDREKKPDATPPAPAAPPPAPAPEAPQKPAKDF